MPAMYNSAKWLEEMATHHVSSMQSVVNLCDRKQIGTNDIIDRSELGTETQTQ